jgi:hypothetical protein
MKGKIFFGLLLTVLVGAGCGPKKPVPVTEQKTPEHTPVWNYEGWTIARGSMHNHTIYSDGCHTSADLVKLARNQGIAVLGISDHREGRTCLGKNAKVCANAGGVEGRGKGYPKYMAEIAKLADESKNPLIIPGLEIVPYVWNAQGFPLMVIMGDNWHFTAYNIKDPAVFENMPAFKTIKLRAQKDPGADPYNKWVDYLRDNGGLVFQAHPGWGDPHWIMTIKFPDVHPVQLTDELPRLTGVALLPEGFNAAPPGGKWDQALMQYLAGYRDAPLWAWGESDYHCPDKTHGLRLGTTLFYLKDYTRDSVLDAIKKGRFVALMGEAFQEVFVSEFSVGDNQPARNKIMLGEQVRLAGPALVKFSLNKDVPIKEARLVRDGKVIYTTNAASFEFADKDALEKRLNCYYRVEVIGPGPVEQDNANLIYTNPVFVSFK